MTEKFIWSNCALWLWLITSRTSNSKENYASQCVHNIYLIEGVIAESGYYRSFAHIGGARSDQRDGGAVVGPRHLAPPVYGHRGQEREEPWELIKPHSSLSGNGKSLLYVSGLEFFGSGSA